MTSETIDKYLILLILGENQAQGRITYKALDSNTKQKVVIKQFLFATTNSQWSGYQALEKEINILQQLDHPHIPKYIDKINSEQGICLVQEYIDTDNCENQDLTTEEVYILAEQILGILIYLESQNIVHKDIKPANILWDNNKQQAYLIDFGFSSLINSAGVSSTLLGTVGFMSPEQLFKGKISHQGDLYSLGATIYVLLSHISSVELPKQISNSCHIPVNCLYYEIPTPFLD